MIFGLIFKMCSFKHASEIIRGITQTTYFDKIAEQYKIIHCTVCPLKSYKKDIVHP